MQKEKDVRRFQTLFLFLAVAAVFAGIIWYDLSSIRKSLWNQTVSEVSPLMALLSLCCRGVTYLLLQRKNPGYVHFIAHKPGLSCRISAQSALFYGLLKKTVYSHSTNPIIWGCIFCAFTGKTFANLLMLYLLFWPLIFLVSK